MSQEPSQVSAVAVRAEDTSALAAMYARAFYDDPIQKWLLPNDADRIGKLTLFFEESLRALYLPHDSSYRTPGFESGAVWVPPGAVAVTPSAILRVAGPMLRVFGVRLPRAIRVLAAMEREHIKILHYYLAILGTDPAFQGKGMGAVALRPVLERCDREGIVAYLESSNPRNVAFYQRQGFRTLKVLEFGAGNPIMTLMQRDPRPAR